MDQFESKDSSQQEVVKEVPDQILKYRALFDETTHEVIDPENFPQNILRITQSLALYDDAFEKMLKDRLYSWVINSESANDDEKRTTLLSSVLKNYDSQITNYGWKKPEGMMPF